MLVRWVEESIIPAPVEAVFAFHERPDALALLIPPWERTEIVTPPASLIVGTVVIVRTQVWPLWITIEAEHVEYDKGRMFADTMRRGPFARWYHRHLFLPHADGCRLRDEIDYEPPFGVLGRLANPVAIRPRLRRMFAYRHDVTRREVVATASP